MDRLIGIILGTTAPTSPEETAKAELLKRMILNNAREARIRQLPTGTELSWAIVTHAAALASLETRAREALNRATALRTQAILRDFCTPDRLARLTERGRQVALDSLAITDPETFWPLGGDSPIMRLERAIIEMRERDEPLCRALLNALEETRTAKRNASPPAIEARDLLTPIVHAARLDDIDVSALLQIVDKGAQMETTDTVPCWCSRQISLSRRLLNETVVGPSCSRDMGRYLNFDTVLARIREGTHDTLMAPKATSLRTHPLGAALQAKLWPCW